MDYTIKVTTNAINITNGDDINATAVGSFSYAQENESVRLSSFAGADIVVDFDAGDTCEVTGVGTPTLATALIAALDSVVNV